MGTKLNNDAYQSNHNLCCMTLVNVVKSIMKLVHDLSSVVLKDYWGRTDYYFWFSRWYRSGAVESEPWLGDEESAGRDLRLFVTGSGGWSLIRFRWVIAVDRIPPRSLDDELGLSPLGISLNPETKEEGVGNELVWALSDSSLLDSRWCKTFEGSHACPRCSWNPRIRVCPLWTWFY